MERIHIELNNPNRSYFAGQIVEGRLSVYSREPEKVLEVTINLLGTGLVHWTEEESYTENVSETINGETKTVAVTRIRTVPYTAEETYVSYKSTLAGNGQYSVMLPGGTVTYPFQFTLPSSLPSSFTSHIGKVKYILKGEIRKDIHRSNYCCEVPFTVNGIFDLNFEAGASLPQEIRKMKGNSYCACRYGPLGYVLRLPRSGFVPGRGIDFRVEITNRSNQKIILTRASLARVATFHAQGKRKVIRELTCNIQGPAVDEGEYEVWEDNLMIPVVPPTRLGGVCRIIDLEYSLHFEMRISGPSNPLTGSLPVIIGTIPLRCSFEGNQNSSITVTPRMDDMPSNSNLDTGFNPLDPMEPSVSLSSTQNKCTYRHASKRS